MPNDDPISAALARAEATSERVKKRSTEEIGATPTDNMTSEPEPFYTDGTAAEIAAGKRAADDWAKRRKAEQELGKRLVERRATPGVTK